MIKVKKKKAGWQVRILMAFGMITAVILIPTTIILSLAMVPTAVCFLTDRSKGKIKTLTVGAMNFAGSVPFMAKMWATSHTTEVALSIISQPRTIVIIYFAAFIGYLIDWAMTGIVATILFQKGKARVKEIEQEQKALVERWGHEVTGKIPLDDYGFPIETSLAPTDIAESDED